MPAFAGTAEDGTVTTPRFQGSGGGNFPKMDQLVGSLVMITPIEIESVKQSDEFGGGMKDRLTADTVVLDGQYQGEYPSMWWGQSGVVKAAAGILRRGRGDLILGRLYRFPKKEFAKYWATREELEAAFANAKTPVPNNAFFWSIPSPSAAEVALATKYLAGNLELGAAEDGADPFDD